MPEGDSVLRLSDRLQPLVGRTIERTDFRVSQLATATLNGESVQKGRSPFADRMDEAIAAPVLTIVDDPTCHESWGATTYDGEGLACRRNVLIEDGVLRTFLQNSESGADGYGLGDLG